MSYPSFSFDMLNARQLDGLHHESSTDDAATSSSSVVDEDPAIVSDAARQQFLRDWCKQTIDVVLTTYLAEQGRTPQQQSHALRHWRDRMSSATIEQHVEAILLQLPAERHAEVYAYEAAWRCVSAGRLRLAENDRQALKRAGQATDPPLAALRNKLCNLLWRGIRNVTPLSLQAAQIMAHGAVHLLRDTGCRSTLALLFLLLGSNEQRQYWESI